MNDQPAWRTDQMLQICRVVRGGDFAGLGILADYLDEYGFPDSALTAEMRLPAAWAETPAFRLTALVTSEETAAAVRAVEALAAELGPPTAYGDDSEGDCVTGEMNYAVLMDAARRYVEATDDGGWGEHLQMWTNETYKSIFWEQAEERFWRHYQAITGAVVADPTASFFGCSC